MKSKFKDLLEAGIVAAPSAFGVKPASNKPVSSQTGAFGGGSTPANDVQPGERPNPFTITPAPAPVAPAPTPVAPAPVVPTQPKFNPSQPFGQVIPTVPSVQPGTEYTPTPGSVKPGSTPTTPAPAPAPVAPATPTTPKPTSGKKTKTPTQYEVNRAASDAEWEKFKAFQARKQERANILAQTRQAEAELADNEPQTRTRGGGTGRGTGTSGRRIFENNTRMQFKRNALKSLLDLQEAGIADAISSGAAAAWDWAKPYVKTASDKVKSVASDVWKYTSDPAYAAKTMIKYTTPTPGESDEVRFAKTLVGYSPDTIARMQARRGAAASAFDAATANEKLRHYEKMFAASNPASVLSNFAGMAGGAWQASLANKAAEAAKAGINIKTPGFIQNLATSIAGAAAGTGQDIVNAQVAAQAKEAARQKFAREDDWRVLTR